YTVEPGTPRAFALAAACAVLALLFRQSVGLLEPTVPPFVTFIVATVFTAILAGRVAGAVCAALGLGLAWLAFRTQTPAAFEWGGLLQYLLASILIIWVAAEYRRLLRRIQDRETATARQMRLVEAENQTLALIAADKPLPETLDSLVRTIEEY